MIPNTSGLQYATAAHAKLQHPSQTPLSDYQRGHSRHVAVNVGEFEREISIMGGTVLALCGLLRGSTSGLALAVLGGALIWRGHTGHCDVYQALGYSSADSQEGFGKSFSSSFVTPQDRPPSEEF